jgi:muconolactone delta-isomerase
VLIFDAESNEGLDTILQRLPLWGLAKGKVTPLENLEGRTSHDRQFIEQLEQSLQR